MTRQEIQRKVLELTDEDYYGVWEIGWRLATALGVDPVVDPKVSAEVIESLRRQRIVDVYVREWIDDTPRRIGSSGRSIDLTDPAAWLEPRHGEPQFLIGAAGEEADDH